MPRVYFILTLIIVSFLMGGSFFILTESNSVSTESDLVLTESDDLEGGITANITGGYLNDGEKLYILPMSQPNYIPVLDSNVIIPEIDAKSAVIYDTRSSRTLYEKNIKEELPIASLTKVLSAVVAIEVLDMSDIVTITEDSIRVDDEKQDLYLGERISTRNLLKLMLIESSNDAAYALAHHARIVGNDFIEKMNAKAIVLGMNNSYFTDPAGLDDNAFSTIQDLIKLVEYSLNYPEIWDISAEKTAIIESVDSNIRHNVTTTNRLLGLLNNIIGGKTGRTDGALECLILITSVPDYPSDIVSIVLGSHDRFGDTEKLLDWTRKAYRWK